MMPYKSRAGSAYILVIMATFVSLATILTALTVTAASRNITANYADFYGRFDIAVAGNKRAFAALENDELEIFFTPGACWHFGAPACVRTWRYGWTLEVNISDIGSCFSATTTVCLRERGNAEIFYIETRVRQNAPDSPEVHDAPEVAVRMTANFLDDNTLEMLELFRILN
ncbi:MAG: hypothetical protein FWF77_10155 [Defluviitaleaceae bacterium]|nr:hypothetical protein [Defluviitaleaceae bacterium]